VPGRTGVRLAPATIERLAAHEHVVAMKDAAGDAFVAAQLIESTGLAWYSGDDGAFLTVLAHGGVGIVSVVGHVASAGLAEVARAWEVGDHAA
ncbi:dihydrodipicolinate synthase family protein, partial [Klebsiella pneumoniae]|uniref:dihydrodipicolinate synthase family protein n=1 Tax=Klebsiella pneumoniae TaxID=573 RepID=UPI0040453F71